MADFDYLPAKFPKPSSDTYLGRVNIINQGVLAVGALVINKTSRILKVPKGFILSDWRFRIADADSNGAPTVLFSIGDAGLVNRIATTLNTAQAGGEVTALNDTGFLYEFLADTDILWTTTTAAATAQAAAFKIALSGHMR